jgi:small-conductance mechanosensitive channel
MKTLRDAPRCLEPTTPVHAAQVVVGGGVAVAVSAAVAASFGAGFAWTVLVTVFAAATAAIVARRTLGSLFAGIALHLAQPYAPGEQIRLFVPEVGDLADVEVVKLGIVSTTLGTPDGLLVVPNTRMLRAAPECRDAA